LVRLHRVGDEDPYVANPLAAWVRSYADFVRFKLGTFNECRDALATAFVVELPAMITTLHAIAADPSEGQRHSAVRTDVSQARDISRRVSPH
jgi:hypothetical protein